MCRHCVNTPLVDRGRFVSEVCVYLSNFRECKQCGKRETLKSADRKRQETDEEGEDYEEIITFNHTCSGCGHVIGEHYYRFEVVQGMDGDDPLFASSSSSSSLSAELRNSRQEYTMECVLCGKGADSQPVVPVKAQRDPYSIDETYDYSGSTAKKQTEEKKCDVDDGEDCDEKVEKSWAEQAAKENQVPHSIAQHILAMAMASRNGTTSSSTLSNSSASSTVISDDQLLEALSPDCPAPSSSTSFQSLHAEGRVDTLLAPDSSKMGSFFLGSAGIRARIQAALAEQKTNSRGPTVVGQEEFWGENDEDDEDEDEDEQRGKQEKKEKSQSESDSSDALKSKQPKKDGEEDEWS